MRNKNKTTNKSPCQYFILEYSNLNTYATNFISTGIFLSNIPLPVGTNVTYFEITSPYHIHHTDDSKTIYIRLNKKIKFNPAYFTFHLNNTNYSPTRRTLKSPFNRTLHLTKNLLRHDNTHYTCISLLLDGSFLEHPLDVDPNHQNSKAMAKQQLLYLFDDLQYAYHLKASIKYASLHLESKNIVLSFEYKDSVRYTTPPTKPIYTYMGYLKVLKYDLKADPVDCVNSALLNQGIIFHDF